jgi:hypothetical protein
MGKKLIPRGLQESMSENATKSWAGTAVRCLAGYRANERPISFLLDECEMKINTILKSWREPDYLYFKVDTEDGAVYELRCSEYEDAWEVRYLCSAVKGGKIA